MLKSSFILVPENGDELLLSGEFSEWLFYINFWSKFNSENGTIFDQYEEDEVSPCVAKKIVSSLDSLVKLLMSADDVINFTYAKTADGDILTASAPREYLLNEALRFKKFLLRHLERNLSFYFSL